MAWQCVENCGACCYLANRKHLDEVLTLPEQAAFAAMVGADGWCVYFDKEQRRCRVYEDRPDFCVVSVAGFEERYGIPTAEFDDFAIACCEEHIRDRYGDSSVELERFSVVTDQASPHSSFKATRLLSRGRESVLFSRLRSAF